MKKRVLVLLLCCTCAVSIWAQDIVIIGQVMSAVDGEPLEAANVWFKGTDLGTTTNKDGFFMLRSPIPQEKLEISVVGYKRRSIKLDKGKDQVLQIYLREDVNLLDEVLVMPGENPANEIIREMIAHKKENNPDNLSDIAFEQSSLTRIDLTNIPQKLQQRRLLRELEKGKIKTSDSAYLVPVYTAFEMDSVQVNPESTTYTDGVSQESAFEVMAAKQWRSLFNSYLPEVNFYRNYVSIFDKNFISPLSVQAATFYNYLLTDSIDYDGNMFYEITFYPKNDKQLVFKGKMWVDTRIYALVKIEASMSPMANINYINQINFSQQFQAIGDRYYYLYKSKSAAIRFSTSIDKNSYFGALMVQKSDFDNMRLMNDTLYTIPPPSYYQNVPEEGLERTWSAMDSLNQSRIRKVAHWGVDIGLNGYLHVWKLDIGPILNMFNYNKLEGARPLFSMRTGEKLWPNFTLGGYVGYGFEDLKWKYGGEAQVRFGANRANTLGVFYDRRVFRYGFDQIGLYQENKVEQVDHLFNWLFSMNSFPYMALRDRATLMYKYEHKGVRVTTEARASRIYSNSYIPFIQHGSLVNEVNSLSLYADVRLSWREQSLDTYFRRHYLRTNYPIVHLIGEAGYYDVGDYKNPYGKLQFVVKQRAPVYVGKLHYMIEGAWIFGAVPFTELFITRGTKGWYYTHTNFALLSQSEFAADKYIGGHLDRKSVV